METFIKEERLKAEAEDADYQARLAEAFAHSVAGECVVPPSPSPLIPSRHKAESAGWYIWTNQLWEWVSVPLPPVWLSATLKAHKYRDRNSFRG